MRIGARVALGMFALALSVATIAPTVAFAADGGRTEGDSDGGASIDITVVRPNDAGNIREEAEVAKAKAKAKASLPKTGDGVASLATGAAVGAVTASALAGYSSVRRRHADV